jgi:hypothetical protein
MKDNDFGTYVAPINQLFKTTLSSRSKRGALKKDWRKALLEKANVEQGFKEFIEKLPEKSVKTIQKIVSSILENGGELFFVQEGDLDSLVLVGKDLTVAHTQINLVVCKCNANFRNCKWFWQR